MAVVGYHENSASRGKLSRTVPQTIAR
jgi:hypothetical protein